MLGNRLIQQSEMAVAGGQYVDARMHQKIVEKTCSFYPAVRMG